MSEERKGGTLVFGRAVCPGARPADSFPDTQKPGKLGR
jgi:hypothetical protein